MSTFSHCDKKYLFSISGQLKIVCLLSSLIGLLCLLCSSIDSHNLRACFYNSIVGFGILATSCLLGLRALRIWQLKFTNFNAVRIELYTHCWLILSYYIAAGVVISLDVPSYIWAAFFALLAFSCNCFDAWRCYRLNRQRDAATQT